MVTSARTINMDESLIHPGDDRKVGDVRAVDPQYFQNRIADILQPDGVEMMKESDDYSNTP